MADIQFCENNYAQGIEPVVQFFEKKDNTTVTVEPCLGYCGDCAMGPFALVNDELIQGNTPEELQQNILEEIG